MTVIGASSRGGRARSFGPGGKVDRGSAGVPIAAPGWPEYIGIGRACGSSGTPFGEGT